MDLKITDVTPEWIWYQMALFNLVILPFLVRIRFRKGERNTLRFSTKPFSTKFLGLVVLVLCVFATYDGDWFSYWIGFRNVLKSMSYESQMEPFYLFLMQSLSFDNYLVFRVEVWGLAVLFYYLSFKRLGVNTPLMWTGFILTTLINFAYMRGVLGFGVALYGYTFLIRPRKKQVANSYLIGALILLASLIFHKSMYIVVIIAGLSLIPVKKWVIMSVPFLLPVVIMMFELFILPMIGKESAGANYLTQDYEAFGFAGVVQLHELFRVVRHHTSAAHTLLEGADAEVSLPCILLRGLHIGCLQRGVLCLRDERHRRKVPVEPYIPDDILHVPPVVQLSDSAEGDGLAESLSHLCDVAGSKLQLCVCLLSATY